MRNLYDKLEQCVKNDSPCFTKFLPTNKVLESRNMKIPDNIVKIEFNAFKNAERRIIGFFPREYLEYLKESDLLDMFPIKYLVIKPIFSETKLEHRALLGSILSLGLNRSMIGDIIIKDSKAFFVCYENIINLITDELSHIGKINVEVSICNDFEYLKLLEPDMKLINLVVASNRMDVIIKQLYNLSRTESSNMIKRGLVKVNQEEVSKIHINFNENDVISVRGKGKFRIKKINGETKKGRLSISVQKYI